MLSVIVISAALAVAAPGPRPCDIYGAAGTPCVAAHSVVRSLYAAYTGPLYAVARTKDNTTQDIGVTAEGAANSAAQDTFCGGTPCTIFKIYDQSPKANHLDLAPPGGAANHPDVGTNATSQRLVIYGRPVYAAVFDGGEG
jgi:hypothetical protein